ncbi:MAG: MerR family transcriptional regulator [Nocardioides sp.]
MSGQSDDGTPDLLTIDDLASVTGVTVRTCRYYASLGLLPPPVRRGRMAYYGTAHRGRLDLIRALQDHGFTLSAIEKYLARIPLDASPETLAMQRSILTSWAPGPSEDLTREQLERRAGRDLDGPVLTHLIDTGAVEVRGDLYAVQPGFDTAVAVLDLDLPMDGILAAHEAIQRHTEALAQELTEIFRHRVLAPYRESRHSEVDDARFETTMARLRQLTLDAIVSGFRRASNQVISRSFPRD